MPAPRPSQLASMPPLGRRVPRPRPLRRGVRRPRATAVVVAVAAMAAPLAGVPSPTAAGADGGSDCAVIADVVLARLASDVDGDGAVGLDDLLAILSAWGTAPAPWRVVSAQTSFEGSFANCECRCDGFASSTATTLEAAWVLDGFCGGAEGLASLAIDAAAISFTGAGSAAVGCCGDAATSSSRVRLELELEAVEPVAYEWTATLDPCAVAADVGQVTLAGPGLALDGPNVAAGTLVPGTWTIVAEGAALADCALGSCGVASAFTLSLDAARDPRDVDGDGSVGLDDLLAVLAGWTG